MSKLGAGLASRFAPNLLSAESLVARAGRTLAPDAIYGAGRGGVVDGDPLSGAVAATAGSAAGNLLGKGIGGAIKGVAQSPASQYLASQGVFQTVGQKMGGLAKATEDRMMSLPWVGDAVGKLRTDSFQDFNRAAFRQGGEPIGAQVDNFGENGLNSLQGKIGGAYDNATAGVNVPLDNQWPIDLQGVAAASNRLPPAARTSFGQAMDNTAGVLDQAGAITGDLYQNAMRSLKGYKANASAAAGGFDGDYKDALSLTQGALRGQMERGGGQSVVDGLGNADAAYRNFKTLADAAARAKNTGQVFSPAQLNMSAFKTQGNFPGQRPFAQLADAGQEVLPSKIPDSGTAGRLAQLGMPGMLTGAAGLGAGAGYASDTNPMSTALGSLAAITALRAGATKPVQGILSKLLINSGKSPGRDLTASQVRKLGGLFGKASIPLLLEQGN
jgi:hypothetical protein